MLIPGLKASANALVRVVELRLLGTLSLSCVDPTSVLPLLSAASCRVEVSPTVDAQVVRALLDAGALHVVCVVNEEILAVAPSDRLIAALRLDAQKNVPEHFSDFAKLKETAGGFHISFTRPDGSLGPADPFVVEKWVTAARPKRVTVSSALTTAVDAVALDRAGADVQVNTEPASSVSPVDCLVAMLKSDRPDGLFTTLIVDEALVGLGVCYSNGESIREAIKTKSGVYWSRTRGLWRKGATSGAVQELLRVDVDCDRDCLRFTVKQVGAGFCHENTWTCFGEEKGLNKLMHTIEARRKDSPAGSYTKRLFEEQGLLENKVLEEARELVEAKTRDHITAEAADVIYFALVYCARAGVSIADIEKELDRRSLKVTRRPGNAKPPK